MSDLQQAVAFRMNIGRHLTQLSQLTGSLVKQEMLLSVKDTESERERAKMIEFAPAHHAAVGFPERSSARFQQLIAALRKMNPSKVYIWTPLSNVCGVLRPVPLGNIRWDFEFDLIPEGILILLTEDLCDKMLLDFSENSAMRQELEIELSGQHWGTCSL